MMCLHGVIAVLFCNALFVFNLAAIVGLFAFLRRGDIWHERSPASLTRTKTTHIRRPRQQRLTKPLVSGRFTFRRESRWAVEEEAAAVVQGPVLGLGLARVLELGLARARARVRGPARARVRELARARAQALARARVRVRVARVRVRGWRGCGCGSWGWRGCGGWRLARVRVRVLGRVRVRVRELGLAREAAAAKTC